MRKKALLVLALCAAAVSGCATYDPYYGYQPDGYYYYDGRPYYGSRYADPYYTGPRVSLGFGYSTYRRW